MRIPGSGSGFKAYRVYKFPRGSRYTTIMELGPQNQNRDGLLGPNSIMVVYMSPLGFIGITRLIRSRVLRKVENKDKKGSGLIQNHLNFVASCVDHVLSLMAFWESLQLLCCSNFVVNADGRFSRNRDFKPTLKALCRSQPKSLKR